jgi:hypothetical protein
MGNRWYSRVRYRPDHFSDAGGSQAAKHSSNRMADLAPAAPASPPAATGRPAQPGTFVTAIVNGVGQGIPAALAAMVVVYLAPHRILDPVPQYSEQKPPMISLQLEKFWTSEGMHAFLDKKSPASEPTAAVWNNSDQQLYYFGTSRDQHKWQYAPVPRKGWEGSFAQLSLARLKLYVIDIPAEVSHRSLEDRLYRWASHCNVRKEWIDHWSSWRAGRSWGLESGLRRWHPLERTLVNGCRPGGTCFVISEECDADAIRDFSSNSGPVNAGF